MNYLPWLDKDILILGCGNILFGDDGFGPAVAENLTNKYIIPDNVLVMDAGLSVREILFDVVLSEKVPKRIIIIDILDHGKIPGEVFEMEIEKIRPCRMDDFSIHQIPSSNLLKELKDYKHIDIKVIGTRAADIPAEVRPGLSLMMKNAVDTATKLIYRKYLSSKKIRSCPNGKT